jgi:hypothetical protein
MRCETIPAIGRWDWSEPGIINLNTTAEVSSLEEEQRERFAIEIVKTKKQASPGK